MLWDKLRYAKRKMGQSSILSKHSVTTESVSSSESADECTENESPNAPSRSSPATSWLYAVSRLEKKAQNQKSQGDIKGAIESTNVVLEARRAHLSKRLNGKRKVSKAKKQVARTLVHLAHLVLITDATHQAEKHFKEAVDLYKSNGMPKSDDCMQEIHRELERLRWQHKKSGVNKSK
jgi:hypothetical protein